MLVTKSNSIGTSMRTDRGFVNQSERAELPKLHWSYSLAD